MWSNWCVLCRRIKRESILSLCEPRTLFKVFNQNPIQKTHWLWDDGTGSAKMLTRRNATYGGCSLPFEKRPQCFHCSPLLNAQRPLETCGLCVRGECVCVSTACACVRSLEFFRGVILNESLSSACSGQRDKDSMMYQCCIVRRQCHSSPKHPLSPSKWSRMLVTEQCGFCEDFLPFVCERKRKEEKTL